MANAALPAVLEEIAEAAGLDAAWTLARTRGGQQVFIPARARAGHWLTELVGLDAATKICNHYCTKGNGTTLVIPMASAAQRSRAWRAALAEGRSVNETASSLGVHRRTVFRHLAAKADRPAERDDGDENPLKDLFGG